MIALIQRVSSARVLIDGQPGAQIGAGLVALIGVERDDEAGYAERLLERVLEFRVFPDMAGRMNLSLRNVQGALLLVPQFTLAADTRSGHRPGFSTAAEPTQARRLFEQLLAAALSAHPHVASGEFGAHMQVSLTNDGPVTFWLQVPPKA